MTATKETGLVKGMKGKLQAADGDVAGLARLAIDKNLDVDKLERVFALYERDQKERARRAFFEALSAFQADAPHIVRNAVVDVQTRSGRMYYRHASIDRIIRDTRADLRKHGFTYRFEMSDCETGRLRVACVVTHVGGHTERTEMSAPDDQSGGKNAIQARGSTVTYLQRYTLLSAFGLVAADEDDDGRKGVKPEPPPADEFADLLGAWISKTAGPASPLCGYRVSAYDVQAVKDVMRAEVPKAKLPKTAQAAMAWIEGHIHVVAQTDDKGEVAGVEFALLTGAPKAGGVRADELPL